MKSSELNIVIFGRGLAGLMTALALEKALGESVQIQLVDSPQATEDEHVYGTVTSPTAYEFLRQIGLDEPVLFSRSATSFSFGTQYLNWPGAPADWVQCHHQILPALMGIPLQHHLARANRSIAPLLVSDLAARQGKFAHPPEDASNPLSRAEYGYQFASQEWCEILRSALPSSRIQYIRDSQVTVSTDAHKQVTLTLSTGERVAGDLFIDCSGAEGALMTVLGNSFRPTRAVKIEHRAEDVERLGPACRRVSASASGWTAQTYLQNAVQTTLVHDIAVAESGDRRVFGHRSEAWVGNCIAIGASASVHDPLSPAPMIMLQRDIERLLELVPVGRGFAIERREFNRRFTNDVAHCDMFTGAFYETRNTHNDSFWETAQKVYGSPGLERKIRQFESRGVLVRYDLEPFNDEDWTILHRGIGRMARRFDLQAMSVDQGELNRQLDMMSGAVSELVARMPPHHVYVANMKRYFEKQRYG